MLPECPTANEKKAVDLETALNAENCSIRGNYDEGVCIY